MITQTNILTSASILILKSVGFTGCNQGSIGRFKWYFQRLICFSN
jgi:hypothetical protein